MRVPLPPVPLPEELVEVARAYDDGRRAAAEPRDAATVILLRPGPDGPEAYYLRRQLSMDFAAGMAVFPGGGVDPRDTELADERWAGPSAAAWAERLGCTGAEARALVCAAVRETFEESGVLLAGPSGGSGSGSVVADTSGEDWEADRVALEARELSLTELLVRRGLVLRTDLLGPWDAWLTPVFEPKRYRTWFFVARLPEGQRTRDVSRESSSVTWLPARVAADRADAGELAMMPPTYLTSMEVGEHADPDAVLAAAADRRLEMFCPSVEPLGEGWTLSMPDRLRPLVARRRG